MTERAPERVFVVCEFNLIDVKNKRILIFKILLYVLCFDVRIEAGALRSEPVWRRKEKHIIRNFYA